ncbi:hypothetical protein JVU11DRAFT_8750 [Chiua virens]|nr:hypothetical protein JVU11DRAFT_8750 [Chiua virens]
MIREVLSTAKDIEALLSCGILIHDNTPGKVSSLPAHSRLLLDRDRRLSLTLESVLCDIIRTKHGNQGIDCAVSSVWSSYRSGSKWTLLPHSNSPWIWCKTAPTLDQCSQAVHFNLRDGSLLVDGTPMGRLPSEIMRHPLYSHIFGKQVLDVVPADLQGMDYSTRRDVVPGHQIFFSLRNEDLVIRAKQLAEIDPEIDPAILELIPSKKLAGDLPSVLLDEHVHWLNLSTSMLEIRPFDKLWETSSENWSINCTPGQYHMRKGHEFLIDIHSPSWTMVSNLLKPLDSPQNLLVAVSPINSNRPLSSWRLTVTLPRYGLSFYVDEDGNLRSHNIRDMVYDEDQSIGTMFGLANRLVLRPKNKNAIAVDLVPRCVLIPEGDISFRKDGHNVRVEIDTQGPAHQRVTYQTYRVDTDLGCLTGNVSLTNKLYCAYLHALTSGCGVDPLTGRSGTEEALSLLRSANCWSIMKFGARDEELLSLIASLCPSRTWYPEQLRCMQKVEWRDLPASSQHPDLYVVAKGIKEHCERVSLFQESQSSPLFETFPVQDEHLLKRSALRAAHLLPSDSFGLPCGEPFDVRYPGRDLVESSSGEHRAYTAATTVHNRATDAAAAKYVENMMETWKNTVSGEAPLSLQYEHSWLHPNLPSIWLEVYNLLRASDDSNEEMWMQLFFSLPAMAYASPKLSDVIPVFVAFATDSCFTLEDPPLHDSYDLSHGYYPSPDALSSYVSSSAYPFEDSPESTEPARPGENVNKLRKRLVKAYDERRDADADAAVDEFLSDWPCETPPECSLNPNLYDIQKLMADVEALFSSCYRNLELRVHLARIQKLLSNAHPQVVPCLDLPYSFQPSESLSPCVAWSVTADQLFARPAPSFKTQDQKLPRYTMKAANTSSSGSTSLQQLLTAATADAVNPFHHEYFGALRRSAESFWDEKAKTVQGTTKQPTTERLVVHYNWCRAQYTKALDYLRQDLGPRSKSERALELSNQWPRVTAHALFRLLASNSPVVLSNDWKNSLIKLALLALELQRARRLLRLHLDGFQEEFFREAENEGCIGWSAEEHPDWLLIQLQSNFLVRGVQVNVANEMVSPSSGKNTATQLNMGEGKSSVIVPISAAVLADGEQVVRVIVPKALTAQMFQLLVDRLGGLANRRIYYVPFSRSVEFNADQVDALRKLMTECMVNRGILVVQPEHVLSLKLMTVEKQLSVAEDEEVPGRLLDLQRWLHSHSRDILDESDEILHVRYQLVYTIGLQQPMEGFPDRWTTTQQILDLVNQRAAFLRQEFPLGVEYERGPPGSFPHLRILQPETGKKLIQWIAQDIMDGCLPNLNFQHFRPVLRDAIRSFISREEIPPAKAKLMKDHCQPTPLWGGMLLLRGLLATGILLFAFRERRWRVDYGLTSKRTMLAVPYRAKDVPAQRSEFGHPDVAIILTCLSYYYGGLDETQLKASFEVLLKQDDPSVDYNLWVRACPSVPESLRSLGGINIKSSAQWTNYLIPLFSRNKATVDFYLSRIVFPMEAKEFPHKLSCSGWDLAEERERLLTGFSGTNDNRYLLPLHITQHDPVHQRGTNAKVLAYLLQPENNYYMCATQKNGERLRTVEFLKNLVAQEPEIRVLSDVGAQMLDLENDQLAETWLSVSPGSSAAIYFNKDDELTVLTREGNKQLLLSSPFAQQLDQCVIYLDDAHTRGTDINFPSGFRAAVTLGPKVTKDRLVQGCMRMRKLGHGHSIMFFAPLEVDRRIRYVAGKIPSSTISAMDILHWAIRETCEDIQQRAPHWAQQGMDHASRHDVWSSFSRGELTPQQLSVKWLQPEAKRLQDLYEPRDPSSVAFQATGDIHRRCAHLGELAPRRLLSMDEEQEREVIHEAERERQVDRPPKVSPAIHSLHQDVTAFVKTGTVPAKSKAFRPAFETLNGTSAATKEPHVWSPSVLVTADFEKTVNSSKKVDDYLRPVHFVVSGRKAQSEVLVILSPFEADRLMPIIRSSRDVRLHLYTPRVTKSMKSCDDLRLYSIPKVPYGWVPSTPLMDQLNVFAGQLYLQDYKAYIRLCRFLCLYARDVESGELGEIRSDGFLSPRSQPRQLQTVLTFQYSPLDALKNLVGLRRKGAHFAPTHMGKLLEGRPLVENDFTDINEENARVY